jgi:hypothetical protein
VAWAALMRIVKGDKLLLLNGYLPIEALLRANEFTL